MKCWCESQPSEFVVRTHTSSQVMLTTISTITVCPYRSPCNLKFWVTKSAEQLKKSVAELTMSEAAIELLSIRDLTALAGDAKCAVTIVALEIRTSVSSIANMGSRDCPAAWPNLS